jgi:CBS domain containing-hemolysin-like protein
MSILDIWLLVLAALLSLVAGLFSSADAALSSFSKARAGEIASGGVSGSSRLLVIVEDPPRYLNTALFLRMLCEIAAIILVTVVMLDLFVDRWAAMGVSLALMLVVSFVVIGVAPRTLGRQHSERVARFSAGPLIAFTKVLGPLPRLLIMVGNALTPGRGFSEGPFASEAELRELVDLAEASSVIESGERQMIHSVFELGDTLVREVMVPRTDVVFIERTKTIRQAMSLALRSGYSRIPVIGESLDDIVGFAYLKDLTKRVFDRHEAETTERVDSVMRPVLYVPDSKPIDALLREMQAERKHVGVVVDEYGGTAGLVTIEDVVEEIVGEITDEYDVARVDVEHLPDGRVRVSSRYPVDDLEEVCGVAVDDDDVDTVGGLMGKYLGRVPIAGSVVEVEGLRFEAETPAGRRNRIGTVLVSKLGPAVEVAAGTADVADTGPGDGAANGSGTRSGNGRDHDTEPYPESHAG